MASGSWDVASNVMPLLSNTPSALSLRVGTAPDGERWYATDDEAAMIQSSYLLTREPKPHSNARSFVDQRVVPGLINAAGSVEAILERMAVFTKRRPAHAFAASLIVGGVVGILLARRRAG